VNDISDPVWNEDYSFIITSDQQKLKIALYDQGRLGRHARLGRTEIALDALDNNSTTQTWHNLYLDDNHTITGKLHVFINKTVLLDGVDTRKVGMLSYLGRAVESVPMRLEPGDVILVSNSEVYTHLAKLGTLSLWDHIGLVVERHKQLHFFEATPEGVYTSDLNKRMKFYLKSATLGVRRLRVERTPEMLQALKTFVKEVLGRPYKQRFVDLVKALNSANVAEDLSSLFCSELVAAAYKRMQILGPEIHSNNYLPVDFAAGSKVTLTNGSLGKVRMIYQM